VAGGWTEAGAVRRTLVAVLPAPLLAAAALVTGAQLGAPAVARAASPSAVASESPKAILAASVAAIDGVSSVRVSGAGIENGAPISLNLALIAGRGGEGTVTANGETFQLVVIEKTLYFKGSASFWRKVGGQSAAAVLAGKWLKAPTTGEFSAVASFAEVHSLFSTLLTPHGGLAKGPVTTVRGQRVVPVIDRGTGGILYVAATGKPYPVEISNQQSKHGVVVIEGIDQPVHLVAPQGAIDISAAGH
jgi:hypothetical protein